MLFPSGDGVAGLRVSNCSKCCLTRLQRRGSRERIDGGENGARQMESRNGAGGEVDTGVGPSGGHYGFSVWRKLIRRHACFKFELLPARIYLARYRFGPVSPLGSAFPRHILGIQATRAERAREKQREINQRLFFGNKPRERSHLSRNSFDAISMYLAISTNTLVYVRTYVICPPPVLSATVLSLSLVFWYYNTEYRIAIPEGGGCFMFGASAR